MHTVENVVTFEPTMKKKCI